MSEIRAAEQQSSRAAEEQDIKEEIILLKTYCSKVADLLRYLSALLKNCCSAALLLCCAISAMVFVISSCSSRSAEDTKSSELENKEFVIERSPDIEKVKPHRPVKIKVKRDVQGRYSWELSGESTEEIIKTDRRLRRAFGSNEEK